MSKSIKSFFSVKAVTSVTNSAGGPEPATKRLRDAQVVEEGSEATEVDAQIAKVAKVDEVCEERAPSQDVSFGWAPFDTLETGWKASLSKEFNKSYFQNLMKFLAVEAKTQTIFPPSNEIFTALNLCPLDSVKVSFYPGGVATTLFFSHLYFYMNNVGRCDWARSVPRSRPGAWTCLLRAQRGGNSSFVEEHDQRSPGIATEQCVVLVCTTV